MHVAGSSPLTRGKRTHRSDHGSDAGLIPAHAGKTVVNCSMAGTRWAHPRSRGENIKPLKSASFLGGSSPLTRGKPYYEGRQTLQHRLIPAHAGKTWCASSRPQRSRAHPRSRGENHVNSELCPHGRGLIPAHAGKTSMIGSVRDTLGAHPRSRGENQGVGCQLGEVQGSSPLTRGKLPRANDLTRG